MVVDPEAMLQIPREAYHPLPEMMIRQMVQWTFRHWNEWADLVLQKQLEDQSAPDGYDRFRASNLCALSILATRLTDRLGAIKAPTLVVWGEKDRLLRVSNAYAIEKAISGSRKIIYPDCGHCPQLERPDEFNRDLGAWLADH